MNVSRALVPILILALMAGGCGKKTPPPPPPATNGAAAAREADARARREAEERARLEAEERARREAEDRARREAEAATRTTLAEMVFFDYDRAAIREEAKPILDAKVKILRGNPAIRLRIEGHCDERGSNEYNLALGSRRAEAIRMYLTAAGLSAQRFEIVSFGEERPLAQGSNEASWSRNRRAQFQILAGLPGNAR